MHLTEGVFDCMINWSTIYPWILKRRVNCGGNLRSDILAQRECADVSISLSGHTLLPVCQVSGH
jgi:hypothetical protein